MSPGGLLSTGTGACELAVPPAVLPWAAGAGAEALVVPVTGAADPELPQAASVVRRPAAVRVLLSRRAMRGLLLSGMLRFLAGGG